eukprot:COSAG01_NODE_34198_length_551_cov_1.924779_2_plen_45_part_01
MEEEWPAMRMQTPLASWPAGAAAVPGGHGGRAGRSAWSMVHGPWS